MQFPHRVSVVRVSMHLEMFVFASMGLQNYQNFTEMTSNMIYIVAFCLKCPGKNPFEHTVVVVWGGGRVTPLASLLPTSLKGCQETNFFSKLMRPRYIFEFNSYKQG